MSQTRPVGVILSAVVQILGSILVFLMSALLLLVPTLTKGASNAATSTGAFIGVAAMYGLSAVVGLLTAIGLFRLSNWARYSTLVFSGMLLFLAAIVASVPFIISLSSAASAVPLSSADLRIMKIVFGTVAALLAGLGGSWLYYFNRRATRQVFLDATSLADPTPGVLIDGRRVPVSIAIIGALSFFGCLGSLPGLFLHSPAMILGFTFSGPLAKAYFVLLCGVQLWVGIMLLRLKPLGRKLSIGLHSLWVLNAVALLILPARLLKVLQSMPRSSATSMTLTAAPLFRTIMGVSLIISAIILYFLITRGWAFRDGVAAKAATM